MATATYRIGPSDTFLPGDLEADADTLNTQVNELDDSIDGNNAIPQTEWDGWQLFLSSWKKFYSSSFGGFFTNLATALNDANRDQLIQFETEFSNWASQLGSYGGSVPGGVIGVSSGAQDTLGNLIRNQTDKLGLSWSGVKWAAAIVAVGLVAYYFRAPLGRVLAKGAG